MEESGAELIAKERLEQINKHGRTVESDLRDNKFSQLIDGAMGILMTNRSQRDIPDFWSPEIWQKMIDKPYKERLIISGALIAAEIDTIIAQEKQKEG